MLKYKFNVYSFTLKKLTRIFSHITINMVYEIREQKYVKEMK